MCFLLTCVASDTQVHCGARGAFGNGATSRAEGATVQGGAGPFGTVSAFRVCVILFSCVRSYFPFLILFSLFAEEVHTFLRRTNLLS